MKVTALILVVVVVLVLVACGSQTKRVVLSESINNSNQVNTKMVDVDVGAIETLLKARFDMERMRIISDKDIGASSDLVELSSSSGILTWSYRNVGDYDQDGEVGIPDISMIAQHYLHCRDNEEIWPDETDEVIDGDEDGIVGVSDVTPIAVNYLKSITGYSIQGTKEIDGEFTEIANVLLSDRHTSSGRAEFTSPVPSGPQVAKYLRVVPINKDVEGTPSNVVPNPPVIPLPCQVTPTDVIAGTRVKFKIEEILGTWPTWFGWLLGEAVYPANTTDWVEGSRSTRFDVTDVPGDYNASIQVQNDLGGAGQGFHIHVREGIWKSQDLPIFSGDPVQTIAYSMGFDELPLTIIYSDYDGSGSYDMKLIQTTDGSGIEWGEPILIAADSSPLSVAKIDGNLAVVYFSGLSHNPEGAGIRYIRALNMDGSIWGNSELVESGYGNDRATLGELWSGNYRFPGIAYIDDYETPNNTETGALKLAIPLSNGSWDSRLVDDEVTLFSTPSLLYADTQPMIAYTDAGSPGVLKLITSDDVGVNWSEPTTLDSEGGFHPILQLVNTTDWWLADHLVVSYVDTYHQQLRCCVSVDDSGQVWNAPIIIADHSGSYDSYISGHSMAFVAARPAVTYSFGYFTGPQELFYVRSLNSGLWGEKWGTPKKVASDGTNPSMQFIGNDVQVPTIVYSPQFFTGINPLKIARLE